MSLQMEKGSMSRRITALAIFYAVAVAVLAVVSLAMKISALPVLVSLMLFAASVAVLVVYGRAVQSRTFGTKGVMVGLLFGILSAIFASFATVELYQAYAFGRIAPSELFEPDGLLRSLILLFVFLTVNCYVIFTPSRVSDWIFHHRWLIAGSAFVLMVAFNIHFSNISCFDASIQPNLDTPFTQPLFGVPRGIRSDEWLVTTPRKISAEYSGYGEINTIVRATENYSVSSSYLYFSYSALSNAMNFGYYLFGSEYGISFYWCAAFILSFMVAYELSYILAKKNRAAALLGAVLIAFSSFSLWWSINPPILISAQAAIVCVYYFFETEKRWQRILLALGVVLSGSLFIQDLYPAWQVPMAYIALAFFVWIFATHVEQIKRMRVWDWLIVVGALVLVATIVLAYLNDSKHYIEAVMSTVYPGARFDVGGYSLDKAMSYLQGPIFPYKAVEGASNNSESGTFFNLFPLPMILALVSVGRQIFRRIRYGEKKVDLCTVVLLVPAAFLTVYCSVGFPEWLAKYSLMSYSTLFRAIDFLGLLNVYFLVRLAGDRESHLRLPVFVGLGVTLATVLLDLVVSEKKFAGFMPAAYTVAIATVAIALGAAFCCRISESAQKRLITAVIVALLIPGFSVLPITKGADSVLEKPASHAVQKIVAEDADAKWIAYNDIISPQFLIANGAPTVNSVNYIPNMELWTELDPTGAYNEVYNRYSHVSCTFTEEETSFELLAPDCMRLNLSYKDFSRVGIQYVFSLSPIEETSEMIDLVLLYQEDNVSIYRVEYLA